MKRFMAAICVIASCAFSQAAFADATIYGKLPGLDSIDLSPKGTRYALVAELGGQRRLIVMDTTTDKPVFISPVPPAKIRGLRWASEEHLFLQMSDTQNMQAMFGTPSLME